MSCVRLLLFTEDSQYNLYDGRTANFVYGYHSKNTGRMMAGMVVGSSYSAPARARCLWTWNRNKIIQGSSKEIEPDPQNPKLFVSDSERSGLSIHSPRWIQVLLKLTQISAKNWLSSSTFSILNLNISSRWLAATLSTYIKFLK